MDANCATQTERNALLAFLVSILISMNNVVGAKIIFKVVLIVPISWPVTFVSMAIILKKAPAIYVLKDVLNVQTQLEL